MINEYSKIGVLKGIGEKTEQIFGKVGIATVGDLIRYYPHRYEVYEDPVPIGEVQEGHTVTVTGAIYGRVSVGGSPRMQITTLYVKDLTGTLKVIWFRMPFLRSTLARGGVITLRGRVIPETGRTCNGTSGNVLSERKIRRETTHALAGVSADVRIDQQYGYKSGKAGFGSM